MTKKKKINQQLRALIYGAGAIGRGFLAPLLNKFNTEISFVDINRQIIDEMKKRSHYKAAITKDNGFEIMDTSIRKAFLLGEEGDIDGYDVIFSCVGPNNCYDLADKFKHAKTVISCENDSSTSTKLRELSGNPRIYFGIPDVITSNTASDELKRIDPLMTVTEKGILVLEKGDYQLPNEIPQVDQKELNMHWMCKLFIHNAPHAIAAYLGWKRGYTYIHEAMADPDIEKIVEGSICEMTKGVVAVKYATAKFANMYKEKELKRFRNKFLFDPISRVAREPLRKLSKDNRLILGLRIAFFNGAMPINTAIGTKAALEYDNPLDNEAIYLQSLRKSLGDAEVLRKYSGIEMFDPLGDFITKQDLSRFKKESK